MKKRPIAKRVAGEDDRFGPHCADCYGVVYIDRVEFGPRIGERITYRHVESSPRCLRGGAP